MVTDFQRTNDITANRTAEQVTRDVVSRTLSAWANRDLDATLAGMSEDVEHVINVDGSLAPYAESTRGKAALRPKLQVLLDTFEFNAFVVDSLTVQDVTARASVMIMYVHKVTRDRLDVRFRFVFTVADGLITRMEEYHDKTLVEAFMRLVAARLE